ncbi:hypothetical protein K493DRAFT_295230 [Basidiobolus meristosporus CBS 931.73]|uniref:GCS light chain n=1 Tax=Basidiobolus meristosporus CBS 931.73 TaxID=1314790 RepID=A0A1Y1ZDX2_9FUNG|nr:hypothetical protein K493DRAFT_295230 [Basidiobolus meristosporus CBS 931.73]|eukprot:ORY07995.1 hypothetical protein K493DRAFT_295230 [Basidiobolus meristosporus CBS 931.73]
MLTTASLSHANTRTARTKAVPACHIKKCLVYSGNLMKAGASGIRNSALRKSQEELISSLDDALQAFLQKQGSCFYVPENDYLEIPDTRHKDQFDQEDLEDLDVSVKLFYLPDSTSTSHFPASYVTESLENIKRHLGVNHIQDFVLAFPGYKFQEDSEEDINDVIPAWNEIEHFHAEGAIKQLGVSEFSIEKLDRLSKRVQVVPQINHIDVLPCFDIPVDMAAYAKANSIKLLTHQDSSNILPAEIFNALLTKHGLVSSVEQAELIPRWVLKYTSVIRSRGIIASKGYIVSASRY